MPRARIRFLLWIAVAVALFGGQIVWIILLRGARVMHSDRLLIGGSLLLGAALLAMAALLTTTPIDAIVLRRRTSEILILGGAIILQIAAVALLRPGLSEDVLRYRVDGRMWLAGVSPYAVTPARFAGSDAVDTLVPFPQVRTIYPAVSQLTFTLASAIERSLGAVPSAVPTVPRSEVAPWRWYLAQAEHPYRASIFRLIFAAAAVLATLLLLRMLRDSDRSPWWAALFAWNPLVVLETGGMGHQDAIGALLVLAALCAASRCRRARSAVWLAFATAVKPLILPLAPFVLRESPDPIRQRRLAATCLFAGILVLAYAPPLLIQQGYSGWRESASRYSASWEANGSFYEAIKYVFGEGDEGRAMSRAKQMARLLAASAVLGTFLTAWQFRAAPAAAGYWLCLVVLLVAPVAYPWYLIWVLSFVPLLDGRFGWTALVWSATAPISYLVWHSPDWRLSAPAALAEYVPVYAALIIELGILLWRAAGLRQPGPLLTPPSGRAAPPSCR